MFTNRQLFLSHVAQTSPEPLLLEIERAKGVWLYAAGGKKYLDMISGVSVSNLGHAHPAVVQAVKEQAEKYMHLMVYGEFVESPQAKYAELLTQVLPPALDNVYFTNSGAEAVEGALKLAKRYTGRTGIVSFKNAYHGSTHGALSVMGDEYYRRRYRPLLPDTRQLTFGNEDELNKITNRDAAVIVETVQGEAGIRPPAPHYMQALRQRCTETGALLLLDEIQTGMGRTGTLFAFEHYAIVPDILLLAKAFGGGMPLGAFIASKKIMCALSENPILGHITTFGGHPVCCAAGHAALKALLEENLLTHVEAKGALLEKLVSHPAIRAIRRKGLFMALEFENFEINKKIIAVCLENGLLTDWFLFAPNCMRLVPPLLISEEEIGEAAHIIVQAIQQVTER